MRIETVVARGQLARELTKHRLAIQTKVNDLLTDHQDAQMRHQNERAMTIEQEVSVLRKELVSIDKRIKQLDL